MSHTAYIVGRAYSDRIAWFIVSADRLIGAGIVNTYRELRNVQIRAGLTRVTIDVTPGGLTPPFSDFPGEWTAADEADRADLVRRESEAARTFV